MFSQVLSTNAGRLPGCASRAWGCLSPTSVLCVHVFNDKRHFMMASSNSLSERPFSSTDWPEHVVFFFFLISLRTKGLIFFSWISAQASVPFASSVQTSAASIQAGCFRDEKAPNFLSVENWNPPSIGIYVFRYWLQVITVSPEELGPSEWISLLFFVLYFFINHLNFKGNYY